MKVIWDSDNEQMLREMWGEYTPVEIARAINKRQEERDRIKSFGKICYTTTETGVFFKAIRLGLTTDDALRRYNEYRYAEKIPVTCENCGRKWMTVSRISVICPVCSRTRRWSDD